MTVVLHANLKKTVLGTPSNLWIMSAYCSRHVQRFLKKAMEFVQAVGLNVIKNVVKLMDVVKAEYYMESNHIMAVSYTHLTLPTTPYV